ncbi:tetratricopeptide repeat protein [Thermospira aquatica]|uniref:Tetratricopeptide repeat protein n=1 Tax=Thermospira aquatica TaxID=2828656 RepID=A0AAX3BEG0_9SPIR|nr:tetratricopeptide repeat protein [Thermospira aquatica]URA10654.1 hypothetical protein KDW03_02280 [Thermospira aquatica]
MEEQERVELIRQGNAFMQEKKYKEALACFVKAQYQDGLVRVGDVLYEQKNYVGALKVYFKAGHPVRISATAEKVAAILHNWLEEDKQQKPLEKEPQPWKPTVLSIQDLMNLGSQSTSEEKPKKGDSNDS